MIKPIALVGMMGSGKTTLAVALAEYYGWPVFDTDSWVEVQENKSISEIVKDDGWDYFRAKESEFCHIFNVNVHSVIATGGGFLLTESNRLWLLENTLTIYLHVPPVVAWQRITSASSFPNNHRPLLEGLSLNEQQEFLISLYLQRDVLYRRVHYMLDASASKEEVLKNLIEIASVSQIK